MAMQVQLNISQYTQTNKHCRGKPINNYSTTAQWTFPLITTILI